MFFSFVIQFGSQLFSLCGKENLRYHFLSPSGVVPKKFLVLKTGAKLDRGKKIVRSCYLTSPHAMIVDGPSASQKSARLTMAEVDTKGLVKPR